MKKAIRHLLDPKGIVTAIECWTCKISCEIIPFVSSPNNGCTKESIED